MIICHNCGKRLPDNSSFCPFCGEKQEVRKHCPSCGAELVEGAQFCMNCGFNLGRNAGFKQTVDTSPKTVEEPFYRKWIAEHKLISENKRITWISEFKGGYAVALDDNAPGRELRPFLVRGENTAETVCYMSWTGANLTNGVIGRSGDCFRNGARYLSFILFRSNSMVSAEEYSRILYSFTGISQPYSTSGVVLLISRSGKVLFASQYQENIIGIADVSPLRVISERHCLYVSPEEYNKMTNRERYNASSFEMKIAAQCIVDCDADEIVLKDVFVPRYEGDPSGYFVEFFYYGENLADNILRITSEKEKNRCIFNRRTGAVYRSHEGLYYKAIEVYSPGHEKLYYMLRITDIRKCAGRMGETETAMFRLIDEDDRTVITLGRYDMHSVPDIVGTDDRLYITMRFPETDSGDGIADCNNIISDIFCYEKTSEGSYENKGTERLKTGGGFVDGIVHIHTADGRTESCYGAFGYQGKTMVSVLKERSDSGEEYDQCLLLNDDLKVIYGFNYKPHYGDQCPYGIHIFDNVIYSLSGEEDEFGDAKAVMRNIATNETVFSAEPSQLISNANAEFGKARICPRYVFGSYRVNGKPCFLIGKQNRKLGIMDFNGRTIIPEDADNYFIVSGTALGMIGDGTHYARLPADTFLIVLGSFDSDRYRVCAADGGTLFEGTMSELVKKYE